MPTRSSPGRSITTSISPQHHDLALRLTPQLARHRHEAIPQYEASLVQIRPRFEQGLTRQDIDWVYPTYDRLCADFFERLVAVDGAFLASVDPSQVRTLEEDLQKDNDKAARPVQAFAAGRLAIRIVFADPSERKPEHSIFHVWNEQRGRGELGEWLGCPYLRHQATTFLLFSHLRAGHMVSLCACPARVF